MSKAKTKNKSFKRLNEGNKIWEVLTEAKKHLRSTLDFTTHDAPGGCEYICNAVSCVLNGEPNIIHGKAHAYIDKQLNEAFDLVEWLEYEGGISYSQLEHDRRYNRGRKIQATRKAWLNHMIKTCKAQDI